MGQALYPATKIPEEDLVTPVDVLLGSPTPSIQISQTSISLSTSQPGPKENPTAPAASKPSATQLSRLQGSATSPGSDSSTVTGRQTANTGVPALTFSSPSSSPPPNGGLSIVSESPQKHLSRTSPPSSSSYPRRTFASSTYPTNSLSHFIIGTQTLLPGHQISVSGTPISLTTDGSFAIAGGSSSNTQVLAAVTTPPGPAVFTYAGSSYTADPSSSSLGFLIDGQTLHPGAAITVDGDHAISLDQAGNVAIIDGIGTQTLSYASVMTGMPSPGPSPGPGFMFNGTSIIPDSASEFVIDGQTLSEGGGVFTVGGTPISLAAGGMDVVVGSSTMGLGSVDGVGSSRRGGSATAVMAFEGKANGRTEGGIRHFGLAIVALMLWCL